jgi:hypothetical protein
MVLRLLHNKGERKLTKRDEMQKTTENEQVALSTEHQNRREVVQKLGKFAAYAAPFTVLAFTKKASAASGHGPGKH